VRARITGIDLLTLELHANAASRLDAPAAGCADCRRQPANDDEAEAVTAARWRSIVDEHRSTATRHPTCARPNRADRPRTRPPCSWRRLTTLHGALAVSLTVHGAADRLRFVDPAGFNRAVPRHAAGGDPGQRQVQRDRRPRPGHRPGRAGRRRRPGERAAPRPPAGHAAGRDGRRARRGPPRVDQLQDQQQQLLAQIRREMALLPPPDPRRDTGTPQEREQEERRRQLLRCWPRSRSASTTTTPPRSKRYVSPATREVAYALYYDRLRRRIEERGTRDFPQAGGRKLYGELTMNITVDAGRPAD
jgi:protein TonB